MVVLVGESLLVKMELVVMTVANTMFFLAVVVLVISTYTWVDNFTYYIINYVAASEVFASEKLVLRWL